jgi:hypothetical protein
LNNTDTKIQLPFNYTPRDYQVPFLHAMETEEKKRAVCVWHRRAGKDKTFVNFLIPQMMQRKGAYYYYFPTSTMGRDILWDGMDKDGFKFMDHFPAELIKRKNEQEMKIELRDGSLFKIRGTDKNEPIGVNPIGCVFSEFSRQSPRNGWDLVRPILAENDGWAVFNFTPRGKNHAFRLYRDAINNPNWFVSRLPLDQTNAIPYAAVEEDRRSGMSEEMIQQEYYCSFDIGQEGSYYGRAMAKLWDLGQVCTVNYDPQSPVFTFWDLGVSDSTAIWFVQFIGQEIRLIDYFEASGEGLQYYHKMLQNKPYTYDKNYVPHDSRQRSMQTGCSLLDTAQKMGLKLHVVETHRIEDGIESVRGMLPRCWFDQEKCQPGIDALENYHREYNDKKEDFAAGPFHDWASHGADAFRYMAVTYRLMSVRGKRVGEVVQHVDHKAKSPYKKNVLTRGRKIA